MGWWSKGILGGDLPYDFKDEIYAICEVEEFGESDRNIIPKETFEDKLPEILEYIEETGDDVEIGYQVLGVMMMEACASISDDLKETMIDAARNDDWASEDDERRAAMDEFIKSLESYDASKKIVIRTPGLFETIAKHIDQGKSGLVNL